MNKLTIVYTIQILYLVGSFISGIYSAATGTDAEAILQIGFWIVLVPTALLIMSDAKGRGMPRYHGWWAVLGIIGVLIYHFGFARKASSASEK